MHINLAKWQRLIRNGTIIMAVIAIGSNALVLLTELTVPGLAPISMGITMLGLGLNMLISYQTGRLRWYFAAGVIFVVIFIMDVAAGINQLQQYFN